MSENEEPKAAVHRHPVTNLPEVGTQSAIDYFIAVEKALSLFHFIIDLAMYGDYVQHTAHVALNNAPHPGKPDLDVTPVQLLRTNPGPRIKELRRMRQELLEMFLAAAVDNFETYIVSILREILQRKPEILRTREQNFTIEYVLQFPSIEELRNDIIERKVNSLSYEGFSALQKWCRKKQIPLAVPEGIQDTVVELIATRNTVVHNRGRVDDKYLRTIRGSKFAKGEKPKITVDDYLDAEPVLSSIVMATDQAVVAKYGLPTLPIPRRQNAESAGPTE